VGGSRVALVDYDHWKDDPRVLIDAFAALGLPSDEEAVRAAAGTRLAHGPHADDAVAP
jgi:hypothetical protein